MFHQISCLRFRCVAFQLCCAVGNPVHCQQRQSQVTYPDQNSVERCLINKGTAQHRVLSGVVGDCESFEPLRPALVKSPLDANFIYVHRSSLCRVSHASLALPSVCSSTKEDDMYRRMCCGVDSRRSISTHGCGCLERRVAKVTIDVVRRGVMRCSRASATYVRERPPGCGCSRQVCRRCC